MSTIWLVSIGGSKECPTFKLGRHPQAQSCSGRYEPAVADTVHSFDTYEEARAWCTDVAGVPVRACAESHGQYLNDDACQRMLFEEYCQGNLRLEEVTPEQAEARMRHRLADGRHDPACAAECAALELAAQEVQRIKKLQRWEGERKAEEEQRRQEAQLTRERRRERKFDTFAQVIVVVVALVAAPLLWPGLKWAINWNGVRAIPLLVYASVDSKLAYVLAYHGSCPAFS